MNKKGNIAFITFFTLLGFISTVLLLQPVKSSPEPEVCSKETYALELQCLTNEYRQDKGLETLYTSDALVEVSKLKSKDMCEKGYFSHDYKGESWTRFIDSTDITYIRAGENLAKYYATPELAIDALINSPTHEANLVGDYSHIGVYTEYCEGAYFTTQTFAKL